MSNLGPTAAFRAAFGLLAALTVAVGSAAPAAPVKAAHLTAELVADRASVTPGGHVHLALHQVMEAGWHTYWRNPGDSGEPTTIKWTLPPGWTAGDLQWPTPKTLPIGPLMDYGYEGEVLLPVDLTAPVNARVGDTVTLTGQAEFLVCKEVCVPADATVSLTLPVTAQPGAADPRWNGAIAATLAAIPRPGPVRAALTPSGPTLRLSVIGAPIAGGDFPSAYFFPYDGTVLDAAKAQAIDRGPQGLTITLTAGSAFRSGAPPRAVSGVLALGTKAYEITAQTGPPLAGANGLGPPSPPTTVAQRAGKLGLALVSALLGGLILNLMPCVFPVLSMKAASLTRHAHDPAAARVQGLAFLTGVILTFLILAGVLIAARAAGEGIGWGFQLQSPLVLGAFALVMLLVGLNLSGLFEVGASVQSLAGEAAIAHPDSPLGSLFTGALAVAVAAPCTAPFMAPAIGYALTQGPIIALAIFAALGLGLGLPFTALAFAPRLLARLPRPGAWMETLRHILAFPMFATAAWLAWVFSQQVGDQQAGNLGLAGILAAGVLIAAAAWCYGHGQAAAIAGRRSWVYTALAVLALAGGLAALWAAADQPAPAPHGASASAPQDALPSQPYSPDRLAALRAAGKPVFVNFTAAWCITCQVNDRVALSSSHIRDVFAAKGVTYLVGDWTNRNTDIAKALAEQGRAGVPLYLVYPAGGGEAQVLPQILTEDVVLAALGKAVP